MPDREVCAHPSLDDEQARRLAVALVDGTGAALGRTFADGCGSTFASCYLVPQPGGCGGPARLSTGACRVWKLRELTGNYPESDATTLEEAWRR
jgi:hypothetical protein